MIIKLGLSSPYRPDGNGDPRGQMMTMTMLPWGIIAGLGIVEGSNCSSGEAAELYHALLTTVWYLHNRLYQNYPTK